MEWQYLGGDTINLTRFKSTQTIIMTLASIFALAGAYLNAIGNILCFPIWLICNSIFAISAYKDHNNWMTFVFLMYFSTSVLGLITW